MSLQSAILAATASALVVVASANAQTVRDQQRLNTNGLNLNGDNRIDGAVVTSRGTTFYAAWTDQFGTTEFTQDIYFASSVDDGATWSTPVRVDLGDAANATDSELPKIAVADNGNVVVIWEEKRDANAQSSNNEDIFYNVSTDGGATWMATSLPLNTGSAGANIGSDIDRIWLSVSGDTFHVTWEEDLTAGLGGSEEVFYTRSTDAGLTWSTPVIISPATGVDDVDEPKVEADGDLVIIAYVDVNNDAIVHRSTDGGVTFDAGVNIEVDNTGNVDDTQLNVRGDTVVVSYTENNGANPGGEEIVAVVSQDGGVTWGPETTLSVQQAAIQGSDADGPVTTIQSANNIFVVYAEDSLAVQGGAGGGSSGNVCYVAYTNDGGANWTVDVPLDLGNVGNRPYVVSTDDVVVAWIEQNGNGGNIPAFTYSLDAGATWAPIQEVPSSGPDVDEGAGPNEGAYMAISSSSNTVAVTHMDRPNGNNEVYVSGFLISVGFGTNYCDAVANSTGVPGAISATGSRQVADNDVVLEASSLPQNAFGFFLTSQTQGLTANPGGSQGNLCLGGAIGRYVGPGQIQNTGSAGAFSLALDLTSTPTPTGLVAVQAGETWNFTAWFRDAVGGQATSNFTDGLQVDFQ